LDFILKFKRAANVTGTAEIEDEKLLT